MGEGQLYVGTLKWYIDYFDSLIGTGVMNEL